MMLFCCCCYSCCRLLLLLGELEKERTKRRVGGQEGEQWNPNLSLHKRKMRLLSEPLFQKGISLKLGDLVLATFSLYLSHCSYSTHLYTYQYMHLFEYAGDMDMYGRGRSRQEERREGLRGDSNVHKR